MRKFISLSLAMLFVLNVATPAQERFAQYRKVEGFEVRPGILMMPRYTATNDLCEIGLERLQFSPTLIRLNADLSREEIFQALDELVPLNERGKLVKDNDDLIEQFGLSMSRTSTTEYENVLIRIYSTPVSANNKKDSKVNPLVAIITWKHRKCA